MDGLAPLLALGFLNTCFSQYINPSELQSPVNEPSGRCSLCLRIRSVYGWPSFQFAIWLPLIHSTVDASVLVLDRFLQHLKASFGCQEHRPSDYTRL